MNTLSSHTHISPHQKTYTTSHTHIYVRAFFVCISIWLALSITSLLSRAFAQEIEQQATISTFNTDALYKTPDIETWNQSQPISKQTILDTISQRNAQAQQAQKAQTSRLETIQQQVHTQAEKNATTRLEREAQKKSTTSARSTTGAANPRFSSSLIQKYILEDYDTIQPSDISKYGWFKWLEQAMIQEVLQNEQINNQINETIHTFKIQDLNKQISSLNLNTDKIEEHKHEVDSENKQLQIALLQTQKYLNTLTASIQKRELKIQLLEKNILEKKLRLSVLIPDLLEAQKNLASYTQIAYTLQHELYSDTHSDEISMIKLFGKQGSIAEALAADIMVDDLTSTLDELIETLAGLKQEATDEYTLYTTHKEHLQDEIDQHAHDVRIAQQQTENLQTYIDHISTRKEFIDTQKKQLDTVKSDILSQITSLENTKKNNTLMSTLQEKLGMSLDEIEEKIQGGSDSSTGEKNLFTTASAADESRFFEFPLEEVKKITSFFEDEWYEEHFHMHHYALDFRAAQWTYITAPAPWIVYKIVEQDTSRLNRFIVFHQDNFATVYLHMQDIYVNEWDYIDAGEIMWLSWGTPGTRWAGYMTTGPHLHREVWKNGEMVDPLLYTDLSMIPRQNMLQKRYYTKWTQDIEQKKKRASLIPPTKNTHSSASLLSLLDPTTRDLSPRVAPTPPKNPFAAEMSYTQMRKLKLAEKLRGK